MFQLLFVSFLCATVHSIYSYIVPRMLCRYYGVNGGGKKGKNYDYDFKRKNNVCLSAYMRQTLQQIWGKNFYLIHTRNEMSARQREPKEMQTTFLFLLSSFVTSFYLSVHLYVHLFVHILCLQTQAATTLSCYSLTTAGTSNIRIAEGYMACPLNVTSSRNPFPSLLLYQQNNTSSNEYVIQRKERISSRCCNCQY